MPEGNEEIEAGHPDDAFAQMPSYVTQLEKESDRGAVISGVAYIEDFLGELIKARLLPAQKSTDELFDGSYAPLGGLSAKIDFAYRIGVISLDTKSSYHLLRKLRNDFAHSAEHISFQSVRVKSIIALLYKLNAHVFEAILGLAQRSTKQDVIDLLEEAKPKSGLEFLQTVTDAKFTFSLLIALHICVLQERTSKVERLTPSR